jgi:hypothetical protein
MGGFFTSKEKAVVLYPNGCVERKISTHSSCGTVVSEVIVLKVVFGPPYSVSIVTYKGAFVITVVWVVDCDDPADPVLSVVALGGATQALAVINMIKIQIQQI